MSRITLLTLVGVLFLMPVVAQATLIENQTTPAVIFQDGFEGVASGAAPVAITGTWGAPVVGGSNSIFVTDSATAGFAAYEGNQFLKLHSVSPTSSCNIVGTVAGASGSGDTIQMRLAFRNALDSYGLSVRPVDSSGSVLIQLELVGPVGYEGLDPNSISYHNGSFGSTGLTSNPNEWNELLVTHVNGVNEWDISVNGGDPVTISGYTGPAANNWTKLRVNYAYGTGVSYLDAVPEPSSLALLASSLIGLLCYAWRKRR